LRYFVYYFLKTFFELGVVVHNYNSSTWGEVVGQEELKFKASLSYIMRPCLKKKKFFE
jgi:hypothetical protein